MVLLCSSPKQIRHHLSTNVEQLFENHLPEGAPVISLLVELMYLSSILIRRALQHLPPFLQPLILLPHQARYSCCVSPKHFILSQSQNLVHIISVNQVSCLSSLLNHKFKEGRDSVYSFIFEASFSTVVPGTMFYKY